MDKHLVTMSDGTQQVLSGENLNALDPTTWTAAEPAMRERTVTLMHLTPEGNVGFMTVDRESGEKLDHPDKETANLHATTKNTDNPLMSIVALALAANSTPQRDASTVEASSEASV